jgi:DNA-cytosine methyltransferase
MTVGSLFAGIGGFDLGFERAGFEIRWQVEIDPFCRSVLAQHWPDVRRYEDVRQVVGDTDKSDSGRDECQRIAWSEGSATGSASAAISRSRHALEPVDVICGGFPCQPHSLAGRRGGSADERDLWPQFARLIRELGPRWVVAENVPGLLSSDAGRFFGTVLRDLAACGYDAEWDCLPASAFGAPHRRDRVWIVAYPPGTRWRSPRTTTSGEANGWRAQRQPCRTGDVADAISARLEKREERLVLGQRQAVERSDWWATEPDVCGIFDGLSEGLDDASRWMGTEKRQSASTQPAVRTLRHYVTTRLASQGRRSQQQRHRELGHALLRLSHCNTLGDGQAAVAKASGFLHGLQSACQAIGIVRDTSLPSLEAWLAAPEEDQTWAVLCACRGPWVTEWPSVSRVAHNVPARVDRLRGLGNSIVPHIAEWIARRILKAERVKEA